MAEPAARKLRVLSEAELDQTFGTKKKLASGGDYGLNVVLLEGDHHSGALGLDDDEIAKLRAGVDDVGTLVIDGNLTSDGHLCVSDRLMCLVVTGNVSCARLSLFETEMLVMGSLEAKELRDPDEYLEVLGKRQVARELQYGED